MPPVNKAGNNQSRIGSSDRIESPSTHQSSPLRFKVPLSPVVLHTCAAAAELLSVRRPPNGAPSRQSPPPPPSAHARAHFRLLELRRRALLRQLTQGERADNVSPVTLPIHCRECLRFCCCLCSAFWSLAVPIINILWAQRRNSACFKATLQCHMLE